MSYFQSFHFLVFSFQEVFFSQNVEFIDFCTLYFFFSIFFILFFFFFKIFFFATRCFSGFLHSGMFYFLFIFRFLASQKLFSRKTQHFRSSALWNVLFPKFSFFRFLASQKLFFLAKRCISGVLHLECL